MWLLLLWSFPVSASGQNGSLLSVGKRIAGLESNFQRAEAVRAIKRLQYAYGHYAEFGLWYDLADLFSDTGVGHYPAGDLGKEGIRRLFLQDVGKGKLGLAEGQLYPHIMLQPVITLDPGGRSARGRWRVIAMLGSYGGTAVWAGGIYENQYVLENGVWKIKDLRYYSRYTGRYEQSGWTADQGQAPLPYGPADVGNPLLPVLSNGDATIEGPLSISTLGSRLADLARRAQALNDENEVENLQHIYGYYVDRKMWDDVADLFAPDGTMELGLQGVYAGKARIRRALDQFGPQGLRQGELNDHLQLQTVVHVAPDGRTAKVRCVELTMSGLNGIGGQWGEGIFENEFVKQKGVWKIKTLHYYLRLLTDYEKGWAKDAKPAPGPNKDFPPDRPPTARYEIFPKFSIPPFHFKNPVTGLLTRYPEGMGSTGKLTEIRPAGKTKSPYRSLAALKNGLAETERLIQRAAAYDAAENLASAYGYYLDESMWDETAELFSVDAPRRFSSISTDIGREQIRQSIKRRYPAGKSTDYFTVHQLLQPVIHVAPDGQSARIRARLFQLAGPANATSGLWLAGIYECKTGQEGGIWKFTSMDLDYTWTADYKSGWAHPPEKPFVPAPFPKIVDLPFHYTNPVSGRTPPVLMK